LISVSTSYNARERESASEIINELKEIGFNCFELSMNYTEEMLREVESMLPEISISSLHNPCPISIKGERYRISGEYYYFSCPEESIRKKSVETAMRTAEWAHRLGAKAIVLHMGPGLMPRHHGEIVDFRLAGRDDDADEILQGDLAVRKMFVAPYLDAALKSASELAERIAGDVLIGIETRVGYDEIPAFGEYELFMEAIPPSAGGYWHDFGHAQMHELLGTAKHEDFLKRYGNRLIGMHIHNLHRGWDHRPLATGEIDFKNLVKYIPDDVISVLEIYGHVTPKELVESRKMWQALLDSRKPPVQEIK